jgi:membrane protein YdbS with pleckstrin-like domain
MDILFYNSIRISRRSYIRKIIFYIVLVLLLCIFLAIDLGVLNTHETILVVFMAIAIVVVLINLLTVTCLFRAMFSNNADNNKDLLQMAKGLQHSVEA